jgi:hypothetical protein
MRHLLVHYTGLLPRLVSSYLYLVSLGLVVWWYVVFENPLEWTAMYMFLSTSLIGWFTVLLLSQIVSIHQVFFSSDAVMVCVARVRNRAAILGAAYVLLGVLAVAYTLPYALIYLRLASFGDQAMLATVNLLVFNLFVGSCGFAILRGTGRGNLGSIRLVTILFVIPNILNVASKLMRPENPWVGTLIRWATSHIRILHNPDMLLVREIQDMDVLVTTMVIAVLISGFAFMHFVRTRSPL